MRTQNKIQMAVGVFMALAIVPQALSLAQACPTKIVLSEAHFLGGESFPTDSQIKTNFEQEFVIPFGHLPTWMDSDLTNVENFVHVLASKYSKNTIVLPVTSDSEQNCTGTIGSDEYTYNADFGGITFDLGTGNRDAVFIPLQSHAPVQLNIALPSNCSNCNTRAELFDFDEAVISDQ
jgi:hypothetical protein